MVVTFKTIFKKVKRKIQRKLLNYTDIETKSDLINWLGEKYGYKSYLEISTYTSGNYFNKVSNRLFTVKECLNYHHPDKEIKFSKSNTIRNDHHFELADYEVSLLNIKKKYAHFDIILVDGYHTFDQSCKDIQTALSLVSHKGVIVIHDCNPNEERLTGNQWIEQEWTGQTYESFIHFRSRYANLESCVVDIDYGCGIIRPNYPSFNSINIPENMSISKVTEWNYFTKHRKELLNLINTDQFKTHYHP